MNTKPHQKPKLTHEKLVFLFEKPLFPQISGWLKEVEATAKRLKTGRLHIQITYYSE